MVVARKSLTISTGLLMSHLSCIRHLTVDVTLHIWTSIAHCYFIGKLGAGGGELVQSGVGETYHKTQTC